MIASYPKISNRKQWNAKVVDDILNVATCAISWKFWTTIDELDDGFGSISSCLTCACVSLV